jgi:hypothetical protein
MAQFVSDCLRVMRLAIGRRNENDPDSNDTTLRQYINDFVTFTMSDDVKLFEQYGSLSFSIDETNTTGVYTFNDVGADSNFTNISVEGFITLTDPPDESVSWNRLEIYQDPGEFYGHWGINNTDILTAGYPTEMLYYGTEMVFRTIPDTSYDVTIYGYKEYAGFGDDGNPALPFDYWMRYIAYGAALNYARDYRFEAEAKSQLKIEFAHERKLLLTRTFNQKKNSRCQPRF